MLKADGFDEAIIGIGYRCGQEPILIYDSEKCIEILAREMSRDEAEEFFDFNVRGSWVGEQTPIYMEPYLNEDGDPWEEEL